MRMASYRWSGTYLLLFSMGIGFSCMFSPAPEQQASTTPFVSKDTVIQPPADTAFTLMAVGDIMMGSSYPSPSYCPPKDVKLLDPVASLLREADLTFGNLEGVLLNSGGEHKNCGKSSACYSFRQPEYVADQLKEAGFDILSIANNHMGDFGNTGRKNTGKVLQDKNFCFAGLENYPWDTITVKGIRIGFTAFAPHGGCMPFNDYKVVKQVVADLNKLADVVIVSFHAGGEGNSRRHVTREREMFLGNDRGNVYEFAHLAIDAGADVVLGHGPHVPRAIEAYKQRFISYSMGNFCTYEQFNLKDAAGIAPMYKLTIHKSGMFIEGALIPIKQVGKGGPLLDTSRKAEKLVAELTRSDMPEMALQWMENGKFRFHN